jgi:predicted acetyltransferase
MDVKLTLVPYEDKSVLARLLELYLHDLSEFYDDLHLNDHGLFQYRHLDHYWTEEGRFPYLISADDKIAGLALVGKSNGVLHMAEFFIVRSFRHTGIGLQAVRLAFHNHPGRWEISHSNTNLPAAAFWRLAVPSVALRDVQEAETVYAFEVMPSRE